jgi:hypothetical protein
VRMVFSSYFHIAITSGTSGAAGRKKSKVKVLPQDGSNNR